MATVVQGQGFGAELQALLAGVQIIRDSITENAFQNTITEALSGRKSTMGKGVIEDELTMMNRPTGWKYQPGINQAKGTFETTGMGRALVKEQQRRDLTPEEQSNLDRETAIKIEAARGTHQMQSPDIRAMFPDEYQRQFAPPRGNITTWIGINKKTGKPVEGMIERGVYKPANTDKEYWTTELGHYKSLLAANQDVASQKTLQQLLNNYIKNPTEENTISLTSGYRAKGLELIRPEQPSFSKMRKFFGMEVPPILMARDRAGNHISINEEGVETPLKKPVKTPPKKPAKTNYLDNLGIK